MKHLFLTLIALLATLTATADPIGRERAVTLARPYVKTGAAPRLVNTIRRAKATSESLYIFSRGEGQGFVIISGDDCLTPVLGVVETGDYDTSKLPPALLAIMQSWADMIEQAQANGTNTPATPRKAAGKYDIAPLAEAQWGQNAPYNLLCPFLDAGLVRGVSGCVATSGSIVSYYWRNECYEAVQYDTPIYSSGKAVIDEDVQIKAGTPYNWSKMQATYGYNYSTASGEAVARLMATLGMSSRLIYGNDGTGGYLSDLAVAMRGQVGLEGDYIRKDSYTEDSWAKLLIDNLENNQPVCYAGASDSGAHAFVLDGYRLSDNLFHFNFGWDGYGNGYFSTLNADSQAAGGYRYGQNVICNILPINQSIEASLDQMGFAFPGENELSVTLHNTSRASYKGLYLLLSCDTPDFGASATTVLQNTATIVPPQNYTYINFKFTPAQAQPYNYAICDRNGKVVASGTISPEKSEPYEGFRPYVVTSLDKLSDSHVYAFNLKSHEKTSRGYLTSSTSSLTTGSLALGTAQQYAILKSSRGYYIYSLKASKFLTPTGKTLSATPKGAFSFSQAKTLNRWLVFSPLNDKYLQQDAAKAPAIKELTEQDAGNQWLIEAVADFPADQLKAAREAIAEYEASQPEIVEATSLTLNTSLLNMMIGESTPLLATLAPTGAADNEVLWTSSNPDVATVERGVVTAHATGFAAITAQSGKVSAKCQISVTEEFSRDQLTDLADLNSRVAYTFVVDTRGYLSMSAEMMENGARKPAEGERFVIVKGSRGYYLWSATHKRFVPADDEYALLYPNGTYTLKKANRSGRWIIENKDNGNWLQHANGGRFRINEWHIQDAGNQWLIQPCTILPESDIEEAVKRVEDFENGTPGMIVFEKPNLCIELGTTHLISYQILPTTAKDNTLSWESSDPAVASIDKNGKVTANALGEAVITVTCKGLTTQLNVSVIEHFEPHVVSEIAQISDNCIYKLQCARGYLTYDEPNMAGGTDDESKGLQRFALIKGSKGYYIYNVEAGRFVPAKGTAVLDVPNGAFKISASNVKGKFLLTSTATSNYLQLGGSKQFLVDSDWKTQDDGNRWEISAIESLSPADIAQARSVIEDYELTSGKLVTTVSALREGTIYILFTARGSLAMSPSDNTLYGSPVLPLFRRQLDDPYQQWGIFKASTGKYYLYNIARDEFLVPNGDLSYGSAEVPDGLDITKLTDGFMFSDPDSRVINISDSYPAGVSVNDWFTPDAGNLFSICKTGLTFDPQEI